MNPPWQPCECCDEFWCNVHGCHVFECECPEVDEWKVSPYVAKKKATKGGARPGKKPGVMGKKELTTFACSPDVREFLRSLMATKENPDNPGASAYLEALVRKDPAFRSFAAAGQGKKGK